MIKTLIMGLALTTLTSTTFAQRFNSIQEVYSHGYRINAEVSQEFGIVIPISVYRLKISKPGDYDCYLNIKKPNYASGRILRKGRIIELDLGLKQTNLPFLALSSSNDLTVSSLEIHYNVKTIDQLQDSCRGLEFTVFPNLEFLEEANLFEDYTGLIQDA